MYDTHTDQQISKQLTSKFQYNYITTINHYFEFFTKRYALFASSL